MATILMFVLFFFSLLLSIYVGISLLYPLLLGLAGFVILALSRGYSLRCLFAMMINGSKQSLLVIRIFVLIGIITAVWRACGTIPFIVYFGIAYLSEQYFILSAFLLSSIMSILLGTSFGTVGTMGVILMVLAKSGNVDVNIVAGAIIAGAFLGDRCSPMSSSANLVAALTKTSLYLNLENMLKTSVLPFILACAGYAFFSLAHPLIGGNNPILAAIPQSFDLNPIVLLPAVLILAMAAVRIDVKISMFFSSLVGIAIALFVQKVELLKLLEYVATGYQLEQQGPLSEVIKGGGLLSMLQVSLIVLISSAYSGLFAGTGLLRDIELAYELISRKAGIYIGTLITSFVTSAFACNQTLAVMLTHQLTHEVYEKKQLNSYRLALDLENTVIVISPLIPWNIAGAVPAAALSADSGFIPYALYLFFVPLTYFFTRKAPIKEES
ncbi:MAG: Na+/H+ antiporter NhaC family protein [Acidaminococcaceae bacterium]